MENNVVETYFNKIKHLRVAESYLNDISLINYTLNNFTEVNAEQTISYCATKYKNDLNLIGRMLTGVMVFNNNEIGPKTEEDLFNDLLYIRDCIIIFGAVHCGIENTIHSAVVKINRENERLENEEKLNANNDYAFA